MTKAYSDCSIAPDAIPNVGYSQPSYEPNRLLSFTDMAKKEGRRGKRPPSVAAMRLRRLLAMNLRLLLDRQYPLARYSGKAEQEKAFAKDAGVSWSTVQRALDPENGKTIDIVADLASSLDVPAMDLLSREIQSQSGEDGPFENGSTATAVRAKSA